MISRASGNVERLWLAALQKLASGVAHELRNALNGVAVNLEVVRSRAGRSGVPASALGSYAGSASSQLEQVIAMTDALMSLTRAQDGTLTVGRTVDRVAALLTPALVARGGALELVVEGDGTTRVPADAARLFIAVALQSAVDEGGAGGEGTRAAVLTCTVRPVDGVEVRIEGAFPQAPRLDGEVSQLAEEHGVGIRPTQRGITLTFPA